jgi:hypothetical protein
MKYLRLIFYFLTITLALNGQEQSEITFCLSSSYLINNRVFTHYESDAYMDYRNQEERHKVGFDITGTIRYRLKNRISLESGIGYSDIGYQTKEYMILHPETLNGYTYILYVFNYQNFIIPIYLQYSTKGKVNFNMSFGPSLVFLYSENNDIILRKQLGETIGQKHNQTLSGYYYNPDENRIKKINTSLDLGIGIGYKLSNQMSIEIQPKVSYFLFSNENIYAREYLYNLPIFYKQNKNTKENLYSIGLTLKLTFTP